MYVSFALSFLSFRVCGLVRFLGILYAYIPRLKRAARLYFTNREKENLDTYDPFSTKNPH